MTSTETTPRGRAARFAYDPQVVVQFVTHRMRGKEIDQYSRRAMATWVKQATVSKPPVDRLMDNLGLTQRMLRDWSRRNGVNPVLWDRTKVA